jgi:hypothetical protein
MLYADMLKTTKTKRQRGMATPNQSHDIHDSFGNGMANSTGRNRLSAESMAGR